MPGTPTPLRRIATSLADLVTTFGAGVGAVLAAIATTSTTISTSLGAGLGAAVALIKTAVETAATKLTLVEVDTESIRADAVTMAAKLTALARVSDVASAVIKASTGFTAAIVWSSAIDVREHPGGVGVWLAITNLGTQSAVTVYFRWSDDGATVTPDDNTVQRSDDPITDGVFVAYPYTPKLTTASGTLAANVYHFWVPRQGGVLYVGIKGTAADGAYNMRAQRYA